MKTFLSLLAAALALLAPALHGADFTNAFVTTIPASGNSTPYPSTVTVPVGAVTGPVLSVQVRITGFTHTYPVDVDVFLVAPSGAVAAVFSDAGDASGTNATNLNLIFDDTATTEIPGNASFTSGTYRPANHVPGEALPPLATGTIGTNLTALAAGGVNGDWKLYVSDDSPGDSGSITSWTLSIVTPFEVTNPNDSGTGSLRWALANADTIPGADTITFAPGLSGQSIALSTFSNPDTLGNTALVVNSSVTVDASALPGGITLTRSADGYRAFRILPGGNLTLRGLTVSGFKAQASTQSGAILSSGALTLERCTLTGNSTGFNGGAIYNLNGTLTMTHCTLAGNSSTSFYGGAIFNFGTATLTHCTLSGNSAGVAGGGIFNYDNTSTLTLTNCIVASNTGAGGGPDIYRDAGTITPTGVNLIGNLAGSSLSAGATILTGAANLAPLGNYGGPTQTRPPLANSPAIDAASAVAGLTTDQRGLPYASGPAPDIGAVELQEIRVNTLADENNGIGSGGISLREALTSTALGVAEVVRFAPAVFNAALPATNTIALTTASGGQITVAKSVLVDATDIPAGVTLDGGAQNFGLIAVNSGASLTLHGLTLTRGGGASYSGEGGAIRNAGTLTLERCTLTGNSASNFSVGGAIHNAGALTVTHCTFTGNSAANGGAIRNDGTLALTHSTLTSNTANFGGAIFNSGGSTLTLANTLVANNTGSGPDILLIGGTITATGVNFIGDTSGSTLTASATLLTTAQNGPINLAPLGPYGGPTKTMPPLANSPAIDAASVVGGLTTDQRGLPRASGPAPDIGAVELQEIRVNTLADENNGIGDGSSVSLREALTSTAPGVAEVVRFAPTVFNGTPVGKNTIPLGSQITVTKSVLVDAGDIPAGVTLDGGAQNFRLIVMQTDSNLALRGLTFANGRFPGNFGGAIYNAFGTLMLTRCTLSGNSSTLGGAIYTITSADFVTSSTTLRHCTLSGNTATAYGGAIYSARGRTTLLHCTVSGNTAPADAGSGVASYGDSQTETVVQNSIIAGNGTSDVDFVLGDGTNSVFSQGYNRIGSGNATGDFNQTGDTINNTAATIKLAPLGDYGGPTRTMLPLPGSPAIDTATASTATTDQRGILRPQGIARDIGAVETFTLTAPAFVDTDSDGMDDRLEPLYGFTVGVQDGALDADGDGSSNAAELGNKTSPRDSTSLLRILAFTYVGLSLDSDPIFEVTWTSFPDLTYTIQAKADLNFGVSPRQAGPFTATDFTHTEEVELDKNNPKDFIRVRRD